MRSVLHPAEANEFLSELNEEIHDATQRCYEAAVAHAGEQAMRGNLIQSESFKSDLVQFHAVNGFNQIFAGHPRIRPIQRSEATHGLVIDGALFLWFKKADDQMRINPVRTTNMVETLRSHLMSGFDAQSIIPGMQPELPFLCLSYLGDKAWTQFLGAYIVCHDSKGNAVWHYNVQSPGTADLPMDFPSSEPVAPPLRPIIDLIEQRRVS